MTTAPAVPTWPMTRLRFYLDRVFPGHAFMSFSGEKVKACVVDLFIYRDRYLSTWGDAFVLEMERELRAHLHMLNTNGMWHDPTPCNDTYEIGGDLDCRGAAA